MATDPEAAAPPGPLAGLLVADCSTVLAGPYCTMLLADLGAKVVKVEPHDGDPTRAWGPPWVSGASDDARVATYYLAVNRNKRSIRLDLRQPAGRAVLQRLLERADALVENFRPGALARMGLDESTIAAMNPRLVHLAISGYGPDGPLAAKPGYDFVLQAEAGLMSITGFPDAEGGHPVKVGVAVTDVVTGLHGAVAVLAALLARDGESCAQATAAGARHGQRIDVSLLESTLSLLVNQAQNAFATGVSPGRLGNAHPNIVPYETFATSDGEIVVAVGSERQWRRLCDALGVPELAGHPDFATNGARVEHREQLRRVLHERFSARETSFWLDRLGAAEIPSGPINDILAAFGSPQARSRDMLVEVEHPALRTVPQVGVPFKLEHTPASVRSAPPLLGEQSDEILAELGYERAEIESLRAHHVV